MKQKIFSYVWVSLLIVTLVMLCSQTVYAAGATSSEISNAILIDGSFPVEWNNDANYPWSIEDGWVKSGNAGKKNTSSSLAFSYTSGNQTEVIFDWWNNNSNSSYHWVRYYVDGVYKGETNSSSLRQVRFYLPAGSHVVEISDSIGNHDYDGYYAGLKNVKVSEIKDLDKALLSEKSLPLSFENDQTFPWIIKDGVVTSTNYAQTGSSTSLKALFTVDKPSKFSFQRRTGYAWSTSDHSCQFFINGKLYDSANYGTDWQYISVVLQPGNYEVEWIDSNTSAYSDYYTQIQNVELHQDWIEVDVTPGSLGVEVLYKVNKLQDLELLKIAGTINDDDWATINQMTNILAIDFGGAHFNSVPEKAFYGLRCLSTVTLPEGVQSIGAEAFRYTNIYYTTIPSTVTSIERDAFSETRLQYITFAQNSSLATIGYRAFYGCSWLEEFIMPNTVTALQRYDNRADYSSETFYGCSSLSRLVFSDNIETIPSYTCYRASRLAELTLPSKLKRIEDHAFTDNTSLVKLDIPQTVTHIGYNAFANTAVDSVSLPLKMTSLESRSFYNCKNLKYVELPSDISAYDYNFYNCTGLETVVCRSATPPSIANDPFYGLSKSNTTLVAPSFAVVNYKLDSYWYQFGTITEGDDIDYWRISSELSLVNNRRMEGKPDIDLVYGGKLTVSGNAPMTAGNFDIYTSESNPSCLLNNCNAFTADKITTHFSVNANKWYFLTPMADVNIQDISVDNTSSFVFRYYDGASRATSGMGSSWKNVTDTKLKAGQGYIFQCNANSVITFPVATELHEKILTTDAVSIPLTAHASDNAANKGWNLAGNPYPCYYDIYYMDFTAPITVWTGSTYRAYSISDDDYVLRPMQGFFVQKPDAVDAIVLQPAGRQTSPTVNRASYAPVRSQAAAERALFNIEISTDSVCDMTRVVLNENANLKYEMECDASKFMSMDAAISQIYTIDEDNNRLSINERPQGTGEVRLGVLAATASTPHVISASRHDGDIYLHDAETGDVVNLAETDYTFIPAAAGNIDNRFSLRLTPMFSALKDIDASGSVSVKGAKGAIYINVNSETSVTIYGIDGSVRQQLTVNGATTVDIASGLYIVKAGAVACKIAVK